MTNLRSSQFGSVAVTANSISGGLRSSQFGAVAIAANPAAVGLRCSQFAVLAVVANNTEYQGLGPVVQLGCWTPCSNLMFNGVD